jgi:hypothetical protein
MNDERHEWLKKKKRHDEAYRAALEETERRRKELETTAPSEDASPLEWLRHQDSLCKPLRQQRADRKAAMVDADVLRHWVRVSEIVPVWADDKKLTFDEARREVAHRIVTDSAEGRLGTKESPDLMLFSVEFDKYKENDKSDERGLSPLGLENTIRIAFGDLAPDVKAQEIGEFLTAHCWLKRTVAAKWFPQFLLPSQKQEADYYELPAKEPAGDSAVAKAYRALKVRYGMQVPKLSLQQIADNLPGNHSRDAIARFLARKNRSAQN